MTKGQEAEIFKDRCTQLEKELENLKDECRKIFAGMALLGFHASGRKFTVYQGKEQSLEEAAVLSADKLIEELNKEKK